MTKTEIKKRKRVSTATVVFFILAIFVALMLIPKTNQYIKDKFPNSFSMIQKWTTVAFMVSGIVLAIFLGTIFPVAAPFFWGLAVGLGIAVFYYIKDTYSGLDITNPSTPSQNSSVNSSANIYTEQSESKPRATRPTGDLRDRTLTVN